MGKKINILIVEDHALTRFALKTYMQAKDDVAEIFEAQNAKEAYGLLNENKVDLIIMDLGLPDIDGVSATVEIKNMYPDVKIVILTSHCEEAEVKRCLEAGISAYCSKDIKPDKLYDLIQDVMNGNLWFDSNISKFIVNDSKKEIKEKIKKYDLTSQEKKVLILLANGNTNSQIANKLGISINTTKVHVCNLLQKLSVDDRTQAAVKAIKENLIY